MTPNDRKTITTPVMFTQITGWLSQNGDIFAGLDERGQLWYYERGGARTWIKMPSPEIPEVEF